MIVGIKDTRLKLFYMMLFVLLILVLSSCSIDQYDKKESVDMQNSVFKDAQIIRKLTDDTFPVSGPNKLWGSLIATKYFFISKIGALGKKEADEMIGKPLLNIQNDKIINYIKEEGYNAKGNVIYYDTIITSSISVDSLLNEDKDYYFYRENFKKNVIGDSIALINFGKKDELSKDNQFNGTSLTLFYDKAKHSWIDSGGGGVFLLQPQ